MTLHPRRTWVCARNRTPHTRRITTLADRLGTGRMTRTARRLRERLVAEGYEIPEVVHIQREYVGHWQRSLGAWVWVLVDDTGRAVRHGAGEFGSCYPAVQCAASPRLKFFDNGGWGDVELIPEDE